MAPEPRHGAAGPVHSRTRALDALVRATVARVRQAGGDKPADAMLFLGNPHQAYPTLLVQDPILEPVDKIVWLVILQQAQASGGPTAFPSYTYLAEKANIASRSTLSRVIAILRATRWLSLCARVRDARGRFRGNVYALHDEPLPLADTLHLDPDYMGFLEQAGRHGHARVRAVAQGALETIEGDIQAGLDVCAPANPQDRRLEARGAVAGAPGRRWFSFDASNLRRLHNAPGPGKHRVRISNPDRVRNSNPAIRSSSYIKTTTTTTFDREKNEGDARKTPADPELIFPERLSAGQRKLARRNLARLPEAARQGVLDELAGRLQAVERGMCAIYDPLSYLHGLCTRVLDGSFVPNLGTRIAEGRARMRALERPRASPNPRARATPGPPGDAEGRARKARGAQGIARMRQALEGQGRASGGPARVDSAPRRGSD